MRYIACLFLLITAPLLMGAAGPGGCLPPGALGSTDPPPTDVTEHFLGVNCYKPAPVPDGALLYDCYVECACDDGMAHHTTAAAANDGNALVCWETELKAITVFSQVTSYGCTWTGSIYHPSPGGKPNAEPQIGDGA